MEILRSGAGDRLRRLPGREIPEPGVVHHASGNRFTLGEPDGSESEHLRLLSEMMIAGGLKAPRKPSLRDEIWVKLWGNASFNPVSALTGASLDVIGGDAACRQLVYDIMAECKKVGEAVGARFAVGIDQRIEGGANIVGHKPSTRRDVELGRPMEIDPLVSSMYWRLRESSKSIRRSSTPSPPFCACKVRCSI